MPSKSLQSWNGVRQSAMNEIESAHRSIGGTGRGRRYATQQINYAYTVLLSSQFQGYCRDLHSECVPHVTQHITPDPLKKSFRSLLIQNRKLDKGNPNPGSIGADFNPLGLAFWDQVKALDPRNIARQNLLEELNDWRNAIAHQDFTKLGGNSVLHIVRVRRWRKVCNRLATTFDDVMRSHIQSIAGINPW